MSSSALSDALPDPLEFATLPPLSPTMERAFSEAFAEMSEAESVDGGDTKMKLETSSPTAPSERQGLRNCDAEASDGETLRIQMATARPEEAKKSAECADPGEAKRARRSAIEKKSRQRRQGVLRRMRDEVKQLESVYAEMAKKKDAATGYAAGSGDYMMRGGSVMPAQLGQMHAKKGLPSVDYLQQRYSELSLVAHVLEEDRAALMNLLQSHESFQHSAGALVEQRNDDDDSIWNSGVPRSSSFAAKFRQLSVVECYAIVRESYDTIRRFDDGGDFKSTGANFMGWTDKRKYDQKTQALQYGFTKTFPLENTEELLMRTWGIFCDAASMEHMSFNASVATRSQVLQTMNDDLLLIRRDHRLPNVPMTFVTVSAIFRIQTPKGFTLCMRSIPSSDIQKTLEPHEYYYDVFHWSHFNQLYDENGSPAGCEVVSCGSIADQKQLSSMYWLFELVCSVLRWESTCVAPLFLKCIAPLDLLELTPLSPLSPAMQRAFCEAFCDEPETERGVELQEAKPKPADLKERRWQDDNNDSYSAWAYPAPSSVCFNARVSSLSSPSPAAMASGAQSQERRQDELVNMSPGETKKSAECADPGEAKRARRSAIEKKSRQRRQGVLRRMRDEVKQLESVYAEMAKKKNAVISEYGEEARYAPHDQVASGLARRLYGQRASSIDELQQRYSELSLVAHVLEEDRAALMNLLQSHESFQHSAGALVEQRNDDDDSIWNSGVPRSSSFAAKFRQLSVVECYAIVRESYDTIRRFDDGGDFKSTGANFMGWTDKRKYDQKTQALQYGFMKTFPLENAEELLMRTWGIFCDAASMEHMAFNASVATRSQVLQTMNDDLRLIRRDHRLPSVPMTFVTVSVIFRIQTPKGFTLCMRSIPSSDIQKTLEPHEYYYDLFHWYVLPLLLQVMPVAPWYLIAFLCGQCRTHFNQLYDENGSPAGCEIVTGGSIADQKQLSSMYWLFELVCSVLRWESTCVAPLFLKCA
ncbi:hypothetical protein BBJ28_00020837 [Nothophytophthora sp. Chile5]|nr:hypothetical protein BBJ28_00020837 [Nothophytophthora sp. Chile5]